MAIRRASFVCVMRASIVARMRSHAPTIMSRTSVHGATGTPSNRAAANSRLGWRLTGSSSAIAAHSAGSLATPRAHSA